MKCPTKTLYLHIGNPKTGTTTIQTYFHNKNSGKVVTYVGAGRLPEDRHRRFWASIMRQLGRNSAKVKRYALDESDYLVIADEIRSEVESSGQEKYLVSFEGLAGLASNHLAANILCQIRDRWPGIQVKIIYYIRSPRTFLVSKYKSEVKSNKTVPRFIDWLLQAPAHVLDQKVPLDFYAEIFGEPNVIIRFYDVISEIGLIKDVYQAMGVSDILLNGECLVRRNAGMKPQWVERKRRAIIEKVKERNSLDRWIYGTSSPGEAEWKKLMSRVETANINNDRLFRDKCAVDVKPISVAWMIENERKLNCA